MYDKLFYSLFRGGVIGSVFFISKNLYESITTKKLLYEKEIAELKTQNSRLRGAKIYYLEEIEKKDKMIKRLLEEKKKQRKENKIVIEYESMSD